MRGNNVDMSNVVVEETGLAEDHEPDGLREKISAGRSPWHIKVLNGVSFLFVFCFVKLFGRLAYDGKYLKGKYFKHVWSPGWRWAFNGMFGKLFKGTGRGIPWPISPLCGCGKNVEFHVDDLNNFQGSVYFQTIGQAKITLGRGVWIARGCAIITTNHDLANPDVHSTPEDVAIGDHCWLGTNACIMPGVTLGPHTVVGANAVVTKSFPDGWCVLGGVPAKVIKMIEKPCASETGFTNE